MKQGIIVIAIIAVIALIGGVIGFNINQPKQPEQAIGSVGAGSIYQSNTILATTSLAYLFKVGAGTFGSVVITVLGAGDMRFYDATSTIPAQRTVQATSSLRTVAVVDASQAAGTYTYDVGFYDGLIGVFNGTIGSSTITWR